MGCHTWYSVPVKTDRTEIIALAQQFINENEHIGDDHKKMYQFAIDNELCNVVTELASYQIDAKTLEDGSWILYKDEQKFVVDEYNKTVDLGSEVGYYDYDEHNRLDLKWCGSEPRIGGYPDTIIQTYDQMVEFMRDGFVGQKRTGTNTVAHHYVFSPMDDETRTRVMSNIKRFFETYPDGVITFG